ncbi:hypothetical protein TSTA_107060 [Talaromyces stipitatus ATCC 10500]|uniref:Uncharacterized protein n=1 Tax=Talaromyces stipitatus (strain ATCC 10500 / CBS 375.48 / QM 6759 / NRRL 1006) TaxID=441959 RepID=B8MN49_TALSN|nr:uncharacterized protein TSTA_107060 [Talaromyces stipitatus ATCC 10500]EED14498.1 hypothetical protein TSTA_107060 [Talaromyces stipitatus ATCC 10500]
MSNCSTFCRTFAKTLSHVTKPLACWGTICMDSQISTSNESQLAANIAAAALQATEYIIITSSPPPPVRSQPTTDTQGTTDSQATSYNSTDDSDSNEASISQNTASQVKNNKRGRSLKDEELSLLFKCALDLKLDYKPKRKYWEAVEDRFVRLIGHSYSWKSCKSQIERLSKKRRLYLAQYVTGREAEATSELDELIDQWNDFIDGYEKDEAEKLAEKNKYKENSQLVLAYRDQLVSTGLQKSKKQAPEELKPSEDDTGSDNRKVPEYRKTATASRPSKKRSIQEAIFALVDVLEEDRQASKKPESVAKKSELERLSGDVKELQNQYKNLDEKLDKLISMIGEKRTG